MIIHFLNEFARKIFTANYAPESRTCDYRAPFFPFAISYSKDKIISFSGYQKISIKISLAKQNFLGIMRLVRIQTIVK